MTYLSGRDFCYPYVSGTGSVSLSTHKAPCTATDFLVQYGGISRTVQQLRFGCVQANKEGT